MQRDAPAESGGGSFHGELMKRLRGLSPQDRQALRGGVSPEAMGIIASVLPEIATVIMPSAGGAAPPAAEPAMMDQAAPPAAPLPPPKSGLPPQFDRPKTKLSQV